jgi:hypothetical protein
MKTNYITIIILFALTFQSSAQQKPSITSELLELRGDLSQASARITQLKKDKQSIEQTFKHLEDWALVQQNEKLQIYAENEQVRNLLSSAEQRVVNEKVEHKKTLDKYDKIKSIMGYLAGAFLALLYIKFGSSAVSVLAITGPWAPIIHLLGPFGAFAAGYFLIKYYF